MGARSRLLGTTLLAVGLLGGCPTRDVALIVPDQSKEQFKDIPVGLNRTLDILFVIDNSHSMAEEQASLAANFERFTSVLEALPGGLPDLHLGVISTDLGAGQFGGVAGCTGQGDRGQLQRTARVPGCAPPSGRFIRDVGLLDGSRDRNYVDSLADTFACIAQLGDEGCNFEQPLEAMRRALDGTNPGNSGFLRDDAFLLVVFIGDEDDCSVSDPALFDPSQTSVDDPLGPLESFRCFEFGVTCDNPGGPRAAGPRNQCLPRDDSPYVQDVQPYVDFLIARKGGNEHQVLVAGILGNPTPVVVGTAPSGNPVLEPSCSSAAGEAAPAVRLASFLEAFPGRSTLTTICDDDLSEALEFIASELRPHLAPCLEGALADRDPALAGVQPSCEVSQVRYPGTDRHSEIALPSCDRPDDPDRSSNLPCYTIAPDAVNCGDFPSQLVFEVHRGGASVADGTHVFVRCLGE